MKRRNSRWGYTVQHVMMKITTPAAIDASFVLPFFLFHSLPHVLFLILLLSHSLFFSRSLALSFFLPFSVCRPRQRCWKLVSPGPPSSSRRSLTFARLSLQRSARAGSEDMLLISMFRGILLLNLGVTDQWGCENTASG